MAGCRMGGTSSDVQVEHMKRNGDPTLDFVFMVQKSGDSWIGRSLQGGFSSEGSSPESAKHLLTRSIDAAIRIAGDLGVGTQEWYDSLGLPREEVLREIIAEFSRHEPARHLEPVAELHYIRNVAMLHKDVA